MQILISLDNLSDSCLLKILFHNPHFELYSIDQLNTYQCGPRFSDEQNWERLEYSNVSQKKLFSVCNNVYFMAFWLRLAIFMAISRPFNQFISLRNETAATWMR